MKNPDEFVVIMLAFFLAQMLWHTKAVYPVKLLVTLLHETGHALASTITGMKVQRIEVNKDLSGVAYSGCSIFTLNAGPLGSIALGFLIFWIPYTGLPFPLVLIGALILLVTVMWVKNGFGMISSVCICAALIAMGFIENGPVSSFIAKFLGVCSVLYTFLGNRAYYQVLGKQPEGESDAEMLQQITHIPAKFWVLGWQVASLLTLFLMAKVALGWW
ncbi:MAG: hypothetical protein DRO99_04585 [Candidatus Aenigmatarchaeota archaeon]|nr:MAG: hypothetical protein DRO99_04585 [Candidatus Aenigmarchaeota archaeon]